MAEIELKGVTKRYPDGFEAVKNMNLTIGDGEFMILVGPSGCGKSTALRMIAGLEDITDGELLIGGDVVNERRIPVVEVVAEMLKEHQGSRAQPAKATVCVGRTVWSVDGQIGSGVLGHDCTFFTRSGLPGHQGARGGTSRRSGDGARPELAEQGRFAWRQRDQRSPAVAHPARILTPQREPVSNRGCAAMRSMLRIPEPARETREGTIEEIPGTEPAVRPCPDTSTRREPG